MPKSKYKLRYLPLFYDDLEEKLSYIADHLGNPQAANDLLDKVEKAILDRLPYAEAFEPYQSVKERRYKYYRIYVDNFIIFYVVIHEKANIVIMEVRRFLYKGQNQKKYL